MNNYLTKEQMRDMEAANADASGDMELRRDGRRATLGIVATVVAETSIGEDAMQTETPSEIATSSSPALPKIRRMPGNGSFA